MHLRDENVAQGILEGEYPVGRIVGPLSLTLDLARFKEI